jgi:hypothetical protein
MSGWTEVMLRVEIEKRMKQLPECGAFEGSQQNEDQRQDKLERAQRSTPEVWTTIGAPFTPMGFLQ